MSWFIVAITAPFLWAIANYIDKYLLSRFIKGGGIGSLIIFSCLFSIITIPVICYFQPLVFSVSLLDALLLIFVGILNTFGVLFYLYALDVDDVSTVIPLFQLTPVFGFISAYIFLGEEISQKQFFASIIIILGSVLLTLDLSSSKLFFKKKLLLFMIISTFLYGLHGTMFKFVAINESLILAIFWEQIGLFIVGVTFFIFVDKYRKEFIKLITTNTAPILMLNLLNESIVLMGNVLTAFALILAPVGLVLVIGGYQPLFTLLIGVTLTIFSSKIVKENIKPKYILYKFILILVIVYGGYLLN